MRRNWKEFEPYSHDKVRTNMPVISVCITWLKWVILKGERFVCSEEKPEYKRKKLKTCYLCPLVAKRQQTFYNGVKKNVKHYLGFGIFLREGCHILEQTPYSFFLRPLEIRHSFFWKNCGVAMSEVKKKKTKNKARFSFKFLLRRIILESPRDSYN